MIKKFFLSIMFVLLFSVAALAGININKADQATLSTLPGIGPAKASAIVEYREQHGKFRTVDELQNVKGIGKKTLNKFRDKISVKDE